MNENDTKIVRFHNIFDFDFTPEMGAMYGGVPYFVPAGGSMLAPLSLADHMATHLARHSIIQKAPVRDEMHPDGRQGESTRSDRPLWDEKTINEIKGKLITEQYIEDKPAPVSEADKMASRVRALNTDFPPEPSPVTSPAPTAPTSYKDKAEVIEELKKRGITFNPRLSKDKLEVLLAS